MSSRRQLEAQQLRALRRELTRARAALRARMKRLRAAAKRYRASARRRVRAWYQRELAKLRAERDRRLAEIRTTIARRAAELKERAAVARAEKRLDEHRRILENLRAVRGDRRGRTAEARADAAARARAARVASAEEVVREIEHHDRALLPVWEKVARHIKAGPRRSRAEAFFQWVEEHPEEATRIQADAGDRDAARLWAEQEAAARELAQEKARRAQQRAARRRAHVAAHRRGKGRQRQRNARAAALARLKVRARQDHSFGNVVEVFRGRSMLARWRYDPSSHRLRDFVHGKFFPNHPEGRLAREAAEGYLRELAAVPF